MITLKTDPLLDPEAACVALQIGMNLLSNEVPVNGRNQPVRPADRVVLFPTLAGVELINPDNRFDELVCDTPAGLATASLTQLLQGYTTMGGEVIVCPLCATSRGITSPSFGKLGNGKSIHQIFLRADKVIDF